MRPRKSLAPIPVLFLMTALLALPATAGVESWTSGGPFEAEILSLAMDRQDSNVVFAGTALRGLYRSTDGGRSWRFLDLGRIGPRPEAIVGVEIDPLDSQTVCALSRHRGFLRSSDGGDSWTRVDPGIGAPFTSLLIRPFTNLIEDPDEPRFLYLANGHGEAARSGDGGRTWTAISDGLEGEVHDLAMYLDRAVIFAATSEGLFRSGDRGDTWALHNELRANSLEADPQDFGFLYAGVDGDGIYLSENAGATFRRILEIDAGDEARALLLEPLPPVAVDPVPPPQLFAGVGSRVWSTFNRGESWFEVSDGLGGGGMRAFTIDRQFEGLLIAGTTFGPWRSLDRGGLWQAAHHDFEDAVIEDLAVAPSDPRVLYAVTNDSRIERSEDGGASWRELPIWFDLNRIKRLEVDPRNAERLFVLNTSHPYLSEDGGVTWRRIDAGDFCPRDLAIDPDDPEIVYLAACTGIWKTTDGGASWAESGSGLPAADFITHVEIDPRNSQNLWAIVVEIGVYASTDGAATWTSSSAGLPRPPASLSRLWADPHFSGTAYVSFAVNEQNGVWKTTDGGANWSSAGLEDVSRIEDLAFDLVRPGVLWATTARSGMFRSLDGGTSWSPFDSGLPGRAWRLAAHPSIAGGLFAGTQPADVFFRLSAEDEVMSLRDGRFEVSVEWRDFEGMSGSGKVAAVIPRPLLDDAALASGDTAVVEFFSPENWEMMVKVLDGRAVNDYFWVFLAAATDVGYTVEVTDTSCGVGRVFRNRAGMAAPAVTDTLALPNCPQPGRPDCTADHDTLCLGEGGRFRVEIAWDDGRGGLGVGEQARLERAGPAVSDDSGLFYFFSAENWELLVKVLDGCAVNNHFWVFGAATTNVEYVLTVTDTESGESAVYRNPLGVAASAISDTAAFRCGR